MAIASGKATKNNDAAMILSKVATFNSVRLDHNLSGCIFKTEINNRLRAINK
jgi:hypothetical protein